MRLNEIINETVLVNGEQISIVNSAKFKLLKADPFIDEISIGGEGILKLIYGLMEFVLKYPEFSLGIYKFKIGTSKVRWMFITLYRIESSWQRVHIERVKCSKCDWMGKIANPTDPGLYDTVSNHFDALHEAWKITRLPCPKCGEKLPRHAIWTESSN